MTESSTCPYIIPILSSLFTQSWTIGGMWKCSGTRQSRTADLSVHSRTRQPPDHDDRPNSEDQISRGRRHIWMIPKTKLVKFVKNVLMLLVYLCRFMKDLFKWHIYFVLTNTIMPIFMIYDFHGGFFKMKTCLSWFKRTFLNGHVMLCCVSCGDLSWRIHQSVQPNAA